MALVKSELKFYLNVVCRNNTNCSLHYLLRFYKTTLGLKILVFKGVWAENRILEYKWPLGLKDV